MVRKSWLGSVMYSAVGYTVYLNVADGSYSDQKRKQEGERSFERKQEDGSGNELI